MEVGLYREQDAVETKHENDAVDNMNENNGLA
jgi:hypothetical protein